MPEIRDQRPFIPARDFARSLDFYVRMGWGVRYKADDLALLEQGATRFYLQNAYVPLWAENTMLHLPVDDAVAWHDAAVRVKAEGGFDEVRIRAPHREAYGALVAHVIDPAGVLLHFAQFDPPA